MDISVFEKTENVKKFLGRMDKTFEGAKTCKKCYESCGDIFYNGYKTALRDIEKLEEEILRLNAKIISLSEIEDEEKMLVPIIVPTEEFVPIETKEEARVQPPFIS